MDITTETQDVAREWLEDYRKPKKGEGPALVKDLKSGDEAEDKR